MDKYLRVIILTLVIFAPGYAPGQEWITTNQATISWDPVTTTSDGIPFPAGDQVAYSVFTAEASADPDKASPSLMKTVFDTEYTITLTEEGQYFVGIKTIRMSADGAVIGESVIGWSDDPAIVLDGRTFGLRHFLAPMVPTGLKPGGKDGS